MSYCAWCGTQVAEGAASCPACGRPPAGPGAAPAPAKPRALPGSAIALIAIGVGMGLLAIIGIIAAITIPNLLDAQQKARQKRTMSDLRMLGTAVLSYSVDHEGEVPPASNPEELAAYLEPVYVQAVPRTDGWGHELRYACWSSAAGALGCDSFVLASAGRDGIFEHADPRDYPPGSFANGDYERDIVYSDGLFTQHPQWSQGP